MEKNSIENFMVAKGIVAMSREQSAQILGGHHNDDNPDRDDWCCGRIGPEWP